MMTIRTLATAKDPLGWGMDAQRADDPDYRAAHRACMQSRAMPRR